MSPSTKSNKAPIAAALILVLGGLIALQTLVLHHGFSDPDVYYHAKMAQLLWSGHILNRFPWLPFTTLSKYYADLHLFFHFLLGPFAGHLTTMPWVTAALAFAMFLVFARLLHQLNIKNIALWIILLGISSADFLYRINIVKANTLSLIILFLAIMALSRRRYLWLFILSLVYVYSYGGFLLLLGIILIYTLVRLAYKRPDFIPLLVTCAGAISGILLFPHPSGLLQHLYYQTVGVALTLHHSVVLGTEWLPYNSVKDFIWANNLVLVILVCAVIQLWKNLRSGSPNADDRHLALWLGAVSLVFLAATILSRRFLEYLVPFTLLFAAVNFGGLGKISRSGLKEAMSKFWQLRAVSVVILGLTFTLAAYNISTTVKYLKNGVPITAYAGATQWLVANSQPGEIVFNPKWDEFPRLFYGDDKNYYAAGLDQTFLYSEDPALYAKWVQVSDDNPAAWTQSSLYGIIKNDFRAGYLFLENERNPNLRNFIEQNAATSNPFTKVYSDTKVSLYKVN